MHEAIRAAGRVGKGADAGTAVVLFAEISGQPVSLATCDPAPLLESVSHGFSLSESNDLRLRATPGQASDTKSANSSLQMSSTPSGNSKTRSGESASTAPSSWV